MHANALTMLLEEKHRAGISVLDLTESNPTRAGIVYREGFLSALSDPRGILYEPEPFGLLSARKLIGAPENVAMTASTSEAYSWLFKLLCNPGDQVLVPRPSYPLFEYLAALESVVVAHYGLFYDHGAWCIDFHSLESVLNEKTRAVVVVNPNNPTGNFIAQHELRDLRKLCSERGIAIISDEVFRDYVISPREESAFTLGGSEDALTFALQGLSKAVGLPQMKLAWMIASGHRDLVREAMSRLEMISRRIPIYLRELRFSAHCLHCWRCAGLFRGRFWIRLRENLEFLRGSRGFGFSTWRLGGMRL